MPGARIVMIVTRKFSAVAIDDAPANCTPMVKNIWPIGADRGERRVGRPAGRERAAGGEERRRHHDAGDRQHPERQRVQAREGHVRRADHQRQDVVRQPGEDRDDEQEDHQRRVDAEEAVVRVRVHELAARRGQLGADHHRQQAADEHEEERRDDVLDADHLVIGVDPEVVAPATSRRGPSGPPGASACRPPSRTSSRTRRGRPGRTAAAISSESSRIAFCALTVVEPAVDERPDSRRARARR